MPVTRIIYLDIDGTLRDEVRGVTPQTAQALEQCQARGIYIVLCTGRNPASIQPDVRRLPTDGLIAGGGCYVRVRGSTLRRAHFLRRTAEAALRLAGQGGAGLAMETEGSIFMNKSAAQFYTQDFERKLLGCPQPELVRRNNQIRYEDNLAGLDLGRTPVHKICLIGPQQVIRQAAEQLREQQDARVGVFHRQGEHLPGVGFRGGDVHPGRGGGHGKQL